MSKFIHTSQGYINVDRIDRIVSKQEGVDIIVGGETIEASTSPAESGVVSVIPTQGQWEVLEYIDDAEYFSKYGQSYFIEPVIAWGLTLQGSLVPITPLSMDGTTGDFAFRQLNSARVYTPNAAYDSLDAWLESCKDHG